MSNDRGTVAVSVRWLTQVQSSLRDPLPAGRIGDAVFLLRDMIGDMLARVSTTPAQRSMAASERKEHISRLISRLTVAAERPDIQQFYFEPGDAALLRDALVTARDIEKLNER